MSTVLPPSLPAFALFGGMLSVAGLPIYIFAPTFYAENYGVGLTAMAAVLFWLRLIDAVQDPIFGWLAERFDKNRSGWVSLGVLVLILSMMLLFAVPPRFTPLVWFAICMTTLFSSFSFLTINFYAQGIAAASSLSGGHMQMAAWRETGALIGICLAAIAPGAIAVWFAKPMIGFVIGFAGIGLLATWTMRNQWSAFTERQPSNFNVIWKDRNARRLLVLAFVNALPVAVSSSLFLFFVAHRLQAGSWAGPLLVLFFLSAALSAPFWAGAARRFGTRRVLLIAMINAVMIFGFCSFLGAGDVMFFAAVCIFSGASIGADLTLMPAAFAERLAFIAPNGGQGFGLWSLMNKMTLALAAIVLFPILELAGFDATASEQTTEALDTLMILYAVCPLILKLVSIVLLIKTPLQDDHI